MLTYFTVGESQQKCAGRTFVQLLLRMPFADESIDQAIRPWTTQLVARQFHDGKEPLPEGEIALRQLFLAELRPCDGPFVGVEVDLGAERLLA